MFVPIEGEANLVKDRRSGAVLNINKREAQLARERKLARQLAKEEQQELQHRVSNLEQVLLDLNTKLDKLIEKL
jgi:transcription elongation GreA/GreB family factor